MKRIFALFLSALLAGAVTAAAQQPARIPDYSVNLMEFGAVPDGITLNTQAFEKAFNALAKKGGGHLIVPEGIFLTGPISLKNCTGLDETTPGLITLENVNLIPAAN
ncbi:MAG: hypothetical protein IJ623_00535 [Bacteroidales bacterium]|nr:hypothetical protein [Bacteroidales bacterium]